MSDVEARVKNVVSRVLAVDESQIAAESHFVRDLNAESIQSLELIAAFEEEFDIEMDEDEAAGVQTVGGAVEFIQRTIDEQH